MEVAKDFLEGVEFAADVRGETSRRERSCRLATAQNVARPVNTSAFVVTNPNGGLITNGMVRRLYLVRSLCMRALRRRRPMELHTIGIDLGKTVFSSGRA